MDTQQLNQNYYISSLPRISKIQPGVSVLLHEDVFHDKKYIGSRQTVAEVIANSQTQGFVKLRVQWSSGANALFENSVIERPENNIISAPEIPVGAMDKFKSGGTTAGGKVMGVNQKGEYVPMPDAKKGGISDGATHAQGGIKGEVGSEGRPIEFENKEIILTAPVTDDDTLHDFNGKKMTPIQIVSQINKENGGVEIAQYKSGGKLSCRCSGRTFDFGGKTVSDKKIIEAFNDCGCDHSLGDEEKKVRAEYYDQLSGLNGGDISIEQCIKQIAKQRILQKHLS